MKANIFLVCAIFALLTACGTPSAKDKCIATRNCTPQAQATALPAVQATALPAIVEAAATKIPQVLTCTDGRTIPVPVNGQLFPANDGKVDYSVIYDPLQSGAADLPAKGWWYQPCLPGLHKVAHNVPLTLQAGHYRYIGPECTVYWNDGNHPNDQGVVLINHANSPDLVVPASSGTEAWVYVSCAASDASGFSFALK